MPFIPLTEPSAGFPRVSAQQQAARDADAQAILEQEFDQDMPEESRDALEREYRLRFKKAPPQVQRGFIPLETDYAEQGFVPIESTPSMAKLLALENPVTAIGETALNLASQSVALPVAGLAGLATEAGRALGLTDKTGADVVHDLGEKLTYQPRGEMGKATTEIATYPFQKLAEAGQYAGDKTLAATGSPLAATVVDTAVNALPMAIAPIKKAGKAVVDKIRPGPEPAMRQAESGFRPLPEDTMAEGFRPLTEQVPEATAQTTRTIEVDSPATIKHRQADSAAMQLPEAKSVDEAIGLFKTVTDKPLEPPSKVPVEVPVELQPGRFSGKAFPDDLLESLKQEAPPELLGEITKEQQRRSVLAEEMARQPETDLASMQAMQPGANYVPLINDAAMPAAERRATPLRREDVLMPLIKALDTTIYEGRIPGKKILGLYTPGKETVRIKRSGDIEVAAHEIAHLLDDRIPEIRESWALGPDRKTYAAELKGVSYDKKNVKEGFAEFVRLYMTQPDQARSKAPFFSKWFDDFTNRHEYGKAIQQAQTDMTAWFGQNAIDRARSKIGMRRNFNEAFDGLWDKFRQSTVDDLHGIYRMERDLKGGIVPGGAYETARLSRASHSIAEGSINFGHPVKKPDGSFSYQGKGLRQILEPLGDNIDDALLYFVGRSAKELKLQKREHLFTDAEIQAMLELESPERRQAFAEYQKWNRGITDFAEAQGVINPQSRAMWQRQSYLPFHRVGQSGSYKGKPGEWSGIKALTGGTENIRDVLQNMIGNATMLIDQAVKNEARQKIAALAESERGAGKFMTKIPAESRPVKIDSQQVLGQIIKTLGLDKNDPGMVDIINRLKEQMDASPEAFEFLMGNQTPAGGNVVAVLHGGKPTYYEVADPVLYRALSAIDRPTQGWLVNLIGLPKRVGQMTITLTPDFMVANIARDTIMGGVMSRAGFRPVIDSINGMRLRITEDPIYKDYIANGGGLSSIYLDDAKLKAKLEKFYRNQGIDYRTVLDTPDKLMGFVETLADAFETSTRLGEYNRAIQTGEHPRHAAYLGREVSTDFAMRGDSQALNFMYDTVMFLKPAVLSFDRLFRGVAHDPNKGAIAAKAGSLALFSMGLYLLNRDNPKYQDLKDWDKDANWHFFVGDQHFRYPKIWEIGAMASIAERTLASTLDENPDGLGKGIGRILGHTFNLNYMPQILAPIYEQATNENSFTRARIETPGMENLQPFLRAKSSTSETMKEIGMASRDLPEKLQVNPVRAEALLRGYFNTWAMYGLMLTDRAFFSEKLPESRLDELPVIRRFYSQEPPKSTKYEEMYFDMLGEAKRLHGTIRELDRQNKPEIADEKDKEPMATEYKPLQRANERLGDINAEMREVRRNSALSPKEKREQLDALMVVRNALLKSVVLESKAGQGK